MRPSSKYKSDPPELLLELELDVDGGVGGDVGGGDGDGALLGRVVLQTVDVVVVVPTGDVVGARVGNVIIVVCVVGGRVGNVIIGARVWDEVVQAWVQGKRKVSQLEM